MITRNFPTSQWTNLTSSSSANVSLIIGAHRCLPHVFAPVNCQAILNLLWKKMSEKLDSPIRTCIEKHFYSINVDKILFFLCFKWTHLAKKCKVWNWNNSLSWSGDPTKLEGQRDYHSHCQDPRTIFIVIRSQGNRKWEIVQSDCIWSKSQDDQENSISQRWSSVAVCLMFIVWRSLNPVSKMAFKTKH